MPSLKKPFAPFIVCISILTITACTGGGGNPTPESIPTATPSPAATSTPLSSETQPSLSLSIWLPPHQSPFEDSPAAKLLSARLTEFEANHPSLKIEVRIKEEEGISGLYDSLWTAFNAAPAALPDIIALHPKAFLQSASAGLLQPLDEHFLSSETSQGYDHTITSSSVNDELLGIPYLSDTDVFIHRLETYQETPTSWTRLLSGDETYLFPAGDRSARFTFAQYLDLGGSIDRDEGIASLDPDLLHEILVFYFASREGGYLPLSALQLLSSEEVFMALSQDGADGAVVPLRSYLHSASGSQFAAMPLPTQGGDGIIFTETYGWSIIAADADRQLASAELVRWLMEPDFLGQWAYELGMLPATSTALAQWPDSATSALANRLIRAAEPLPEYVILDQVGPAVQNAIEEVIFGRKSAQEAVDDLQVPSSTP